MERHEVRCLILPYLDVKLPVLNFIHNAEQPR